MVLAVVFTPRVARFNGKHNRTKGKAFIALYHHHLKGTKGGLPVKTFCRWAGINRMSVSVKIRMWVKWKYVKQKLGLDERYQPCWVYTITEKGIRYVTEVMPPEVYEQLYKEILEHQRKGGMNVH